MKYIDSDKLIAKIGERKYEVFPTGDGKVRVCSTPNQIQSGWLNALKWVCETITSLQQEQPEVDLEKFTEKIKTFQERYKYPEIVSIKSAMAFMARMFYQYPNVARQWYDSLPKATMD